jgi:hypothetical protein
MAVVWIVYDIWGGRTYEGAELPVSNSEYTISWRLRYRRGWRGFSLLIWDMGGIECSAVGQDQTLGLLIAIACLALWSPRACMQRTYRGSSTVILPRGGIDSAHQLVAVNLKVN